MYYVNTFKLILAPKYLQVKQEEQMYGFSSVKFRNTVAKGNHLVRWTGFRSKNISLRSYNQSFDENQKLTFKRLNIINLLANSKKILSKERQDDGIQPNTIFVEGKFEKENVQALNNNTYTNVSLQSKNSNSKSSYFFRYSRINEYKKLGVELASPEKIRKWAERLLPTGRIVGLVLNANTLHHKTLKPLKGGLFCERIFGPTKDFRCACGKTITKRTQLQNTTYSTGLINLLTPTSKPLKRFFCKICEVEYTWALTRRYQLGYISLAFPVTHLWYTKGFSSPISLLLDIHKYDLDSIIYCSQTTSLEKSYEITEMGISLKASQVLSFIRKTQSRTVNSKNTLLHDVRIKNQALNQARLRKRKKQLDLGLKSLEIQKTPTINSIGEITQTSSEFNTLAALLKATQQMIQQTSLSTYLIQFCVNQKQIPLIAKPNNYLLFKTTMSNEIENLKEENRASLLLQSLILPLIVTYSTQFFAPFVSWLISLEAQGKSIPQISSNLVATTLLQSIFNGNLTVEPAQQTEVENLAHITQILAQLKTLFRESLDTLDSLPPIIERQYHKALVDTRTNIQILPVHTFNKINAAIYKDFYTLSMRQTKELLRTLQVRDSRKNQNDVTSRKTSTEQSSTEKLSYFITQLKDLAQLRSRSNTPNLITKEHKKITSSSLGSLNQLALYFFLYKLKKYQSMHFLATTTTKDFEMPDLKTFSSNDRNSSYSKPPSFSVHPNTKANKPLLAFYYNLYGIADDHLWDNINDWNLVKSYITIYPDVMDQVIPAYSHRIPSSSMTNFAKMQKLHTYTSPIHQYQRLSKKYINRYLDYVAGVKTSHTNYVTDNSNQIVENRKRPMINNFGFKLYEKSSTTHQALAIKATGAGIINNFLNSITLVELQAMDKHFSFLLKESRKTILAYKTKIQPTASYYSSQGKQSFPSVDSLGAEIKQNEIRANHGTNPYLLYSKKSIEFPPQASQVSRSQINQVNQSKRVSSTRYGGIDKFMEKHHDLLRRAKIVRKFAITNVLPKAMILKVLPVLPPELRPIMKMADQIATSDLNRLYQRVLYRNERLNKIVLQLSESISFGMTSGIVDLGTSRLTTIDNSAEAFKISEPRKKQFAEYETRPVTELFETPLFGYEKHYAQRLLQEAVDNLIDNGRAGPNTEKDAKGRALKSLSEVLKGKQGRFRQYLLGKRVDYSGRSVIVVGPKLKIHECGLPREMAVELYLPFIIQYLIQMKYTKTVVGAKTLIARDKDLINIILENVVRGHPVILNRAPTLHRLGFQAFQPILVEGRAILLHPMACTAFNADFDGDQMAVHIPITIEARSEAWRLMLARNNLLSPATGEPIILPSQDMVLGCYYLTTTRKMKYEQLITSNQYFSDIETVLYLYYLGKLHLHTPIWVKTHKTVVTDSTKKPVEIRISPYGAIQEIYLNTEFYYDCQGKLVHQYIRTTPGRILFNLIIKNSEFS